MRLGLHRLVDIFYRPLFGEDVFISYARLDGSEYARSLFVQLTAGPKGFTCFMDELGTEPGEDIPPSLRRKVRNCSMLILVGSPGAAKSEPIGDEIMEFLTVRRNRERVVPIDVGGVLLTAVWRKKISGVDVETETNPDALTKGQISKNIFDRISRAATYRKQNDRLRRIRNWTLAVLLGLLLLSGGAGLYAKQQLRAASQAEAKAKDSIARAENADKEAIEARTRADAAVTDAEQADLKRIAAENAADTATKAAEVARRLEQAAKKETAKQQRIAESQRLTADAIEGLAVDPSQSLRKAAEAVNSWRTDAAVNTLRRSLQTSRVRSIIGDSGGNLSSAMLSPDGTLLVTVGPNNMARVRDASNGRVVSELRHTKPVLVAAFSSDGKLIVTGSQDYTACVWNAQSGLKVAEVTQHKLPVTGAAFSPIDSNIVATDSRDSLLISNLASNTNVELPVPSGGGIFKPTIAFSPDGKLVAALRNTGSGAAARICEVSKQRCDIEVRNPSSSYTTLAFHPDSKVLITGSMDGTVQWWDTAGNFLFERKDHTADIWSVSFSPDKKYVVTTSGGFSNQMTVGSADDFSPRVWEVSKGKLVAILRGHTNTVQGAVFSRDSRFIVTASWDKTASVWEATTGRLLTRLIGHNNAVNTAVFTADGRRVLTASADSTARIWDAGIGQVLTQISGQPVAKLNIRFTPDGRNVLVAKDSATVTICSTQTAQCRDEGRKSADLLFKSRLTPNGAYDNKYKIVPLADGTELVINAATRQTITKLEGQTSPGPYSAPFRREFNPKLSSDGKRLLTVRENYTAQVWEVASGRLISVLIGQRGVLNDGNFSPDGESVVLASGGGSAGVYRVNDGTREADLVGHTGILSAAFSSDGQFVVTTGMDGTARVWKAKTGKLLATMEGHFNWVQSAAFSPDNRFIITAARDKTARIWETRTGKVVAVFQLQVGNEFDVAFSPDAQSVVTASDEGTVRLYSCEVCGSIENLLNTAKNRMP